MKLSIVIICWNDWKVIEDCLRSILDRTRRIEYEVIVSDNGSTDGSVERIRAHFPAVRILENKANLGFAKANNAGIRKAQGEYVLILNPDTIVHDGSLERWLDFADRHPEAGAFGCRVLNPDGSYSRSARPFPTVRRSLISALWLRPLAYFGGVFESEEYEGWKGDSEREVDWQSGCCLMLRRDVLLQLGGFDEQFFYHYEEVDLCRRVWSAGYSIRFTPDASITHLGGQSVRRFPLRFVLETNRNRYKYFYKHFGKKGAIQCRRVVLTHLAARRIGYGLAYKIGPNDLLKNRLEAYRIATDWNRRLDPVQFVEHGVEPVVNPGMSVPAS